MLTADLMQTTGDVFRGLLLIAESQNVPVKIYENRARVEGKLLIVPVFITGELDAFDFASQLQDLEDAWNNQESKPEWHVILRPAGS